MYKEDDIKANKCVLIPIRELAELEDKAKKAKSADIVISWGYYRYNRGYSFDVGGDLVLSSSLYEKVRRIANLIDDAAEKKLRKADEIMKEREEEIIQDTVDKFTALPWYKRLWFNPKYLQE